jgi:SOS-response transcriptional repressor LexA
VKSIHDTRRENLRLLIDRQFGGSQTQLAQAVGLGQPSFVSRLLTDNEGTRKNIGNRLARRVEQSLGLSPNWLDTPDAGAQTGPRYNLDLDLGFDLVAGQPRRSGRSRPLSVSAQGRAGQAPVFSAAELGQFASIAAALAARPSGQGIAVQLAYAPQHLLGLRLPDDSMAERFPAGSIVVITDDKAPRANDFVVGVAPGAQVASMRHWVEAGERRFLLPLNPTYSAAEAAAGYRLLGVVVEAIQLFE